MADYKRINVRLDSGTAEVPSGMSWYVSRVDSGSATYGIQTDENSFDGFVVQVGSTIPGGSTVEGTIEFGVIEYVVSDDVNTEDVINIAEETINPADPMNSDHHEIKYAHLFGQFRADKGYYSSGSWSGRGSGLYTEGDWINLQLTEYANGYNPASAPFSNYRSNPDLPNGLSIDVDTGIIKGIATQEAFNVLYTITADVDGSDDTVSTKVMLINRESPGVALVYGTGSDYWWYGPETEYVFQGEEVEVGEDEGYKGYFSLVFSKDPTHPVSVSLSYDESLLGLGEEGIFELGDTVSLNDFSEIDNESHTFRVLPVANEYGKVTLKSPVSVSLQSDDPGYDGISLNTIFNCDYNINPYIYYYNVGDPNVNSLSSSHDNLEFSMTINEAIPQNIEFELAIVDNYGDDFSNKSQYASVTGSVYFSNSNFTESVSYDHISSECESDSTINVTLTGVEFSHRTLHLVARVSEDQGVPLGELRDDGYYYKFIGQIEASNGIISDPGNNNGVTNASSLSELYIEGSMNNDYSNGLNFNFPYFSTEDASVPGEFYYEIPKNINRFTFGYEESLYTGEFSDGSELEWTFDMDVLVDGYSEVLNNITSIGIEEFDYVSNEITLPGGLRLDFLKKYTVILEDDSEEVRLGPVAYISNEFRESDIGTGWIEISSSLSDFVNVSVSNSDGVYTLSIGDQEISIDYSSKLSKLTASAYSSLRLIDDTSLTEYPSDVNIGYKIRFNDSRGVIKQ